MKRRRWKPEQKALIVLEGLKGRPIGALCAEHEISQAQYYQWRDLELKKARRCSADARAIRQAGGAVGSPEHDLGAKRLAVSELEAAALAKLAPPGRGLGGWPPHCPHRLSSSRSPLPHGPGDSRTWIPTARRSGAALMPDPGSQPRRSGSRRPAVAGAPPMAENSAEFPEPAKAAGQGRPMANATGGAFLRHLLAGKGVEIAAFRPLFGPRSVVASLRGRKSPPAQRLRRRAQMQQE